MGYALLWIENLAVDLLIVATLVACIGRLKRPRLRLALSLLVALPILVASAIAMAGLGYLRFVRSILDGGLFYPLLISTGCYVIGVGWILSVGLRRRTDDLVATVASTWPRAKLAIVLAVAIGLHMMTLWNLDLAVRQQMASLKAESGALALSVAPARLPDRDNAALIYEQTYEMFNPKSWSEDRRKKWEQWTDFDSKEFDPDDPNLKSLLDEQASTMKLLWQAGKKPGCYFERNYGFPSIDWDLSELSKLRDAARLLGLDARYRATQGDMQTALQNVDTMFKIAEHVGADPILISVLVANAIDAIATDTLQEIFAAEGNLAGDERITIEQLQTIAPDGSLSFQRLCSRAFRLEIAYALNTIQQLSSGSEWSGLSSILGGGEAPPPPTLAFYRMFMATADAASYREVMGACSRIAAKPYFEAKSEWEDFHKEFETKPKGIITAMFMPALSKAVRVMAHGDARHRTARLALAAARYRAEKGELPKTLDALMPDYILILPRDPFDGKPMKYRETDDGAVIYSIGLDGTDDNGTLWDKDAEVGDVMFELKK